MINYFIVAPVEGSSDRNRSTAPEHHATPGTTLITQVGDKKKGSTICPMSEIVCFPVLIFTYSHVENSLFFALDLAVSL